MAAPFDVGDTAEELPAGYLEEADAERLRAAQASHYIHAKDWMRLLLQNPEHSTKNAMNSPVYQEKRFANLGLPYLKYHYDKRNNGVWIWMPAQGYVSVPRKQQQAGAGDGKSGKIMRYGKRAFLVWLTA